MELSETRMA